ncbi:DNA-binding transcriptional LysR family regulator [Ensifer mexicanus]|nr:DNA-binding transcriptional LysR family regulator [Sinorhizobium mexicanum]
MALTRAGEVFYNRSIRILSEVDVSAEVARSVAGKRVKQIKIGTVYPATIGVLPAFLARIARKYPDIQLHIASGTTNDIIRNLENGQINLGFIRPVENIGSLRFFSIAHERYLLAVEKSSPLAVRSEIGIEDLKDQKIISFSRANLSYTERYFAEKFEEHDLTKNIAYTCDDTFSLVSLVSSGLGIGFAPEWTDGMPNRNFELRKVSGIDFRIGLGVAWNKILWGVDSGLHRGRVSSLKSLWRPTMLTTADQPEAPAAIRIDFGAVLVSLELSKSIWLVTSLSPGSEKMSRHTVAGGDIAGLLSCFTELRKNVRSRERRLYPLVVIQEAGLDGFWISRALNNEAWIESSHCRRRFDRGTAPSPSRKDRSY